MLNVSGIPIKVYKKAIKNMHIYVKAPLGSVSVSAPLAIPNESIEQFVHSKISWIKKQLAKFDGLLRQPERKYLSGDTIYLWGKQYYIQTTFGNRNSLSLSGDNVMLTVREKSSIEQRESFVREWYRGLLKLEIARLLPKWEEITGLHATGWQTKHMSTRWGTCNTKTGKIWINLQLARKAPICLEYIILHELLHLTERRHNQHFFALMDKYMPTWRKIRATLNGSRSQ